MNFLAVHNHGGVNENWVGVSGTGPDNRGYYCFSSPVYLGLYVSWFPLGTLYQNVALQPCHKLIESVCPSDLNSFC